LYRIFQLALETITWHASSNNSAAYFKVNNSLNADGFKCLPSFSKNETNCIELSAAIVSSHLLTTELFGAVNVSSSYRFIRFSSIKVTQHGGGCEHETAESGTRGGGGKNERKNFQIWVAHGHFSHVSHVVRLDETLFFSKNVI
jgi:hypothetical protein